mmetsp:Transcript_1568/g.2422  ORF Transcript_1568/g.2422 Transcript_1568/m.2422 type:complete len:718 (+) Transcript_1568:454-2607(+)|eukprot:CAMPEP_0203743734 /NCGR_PEP_ID=MMETSP0098-20131031/46_1 /ASSEMBLY_ACC=CAM_ASM_000208 /TAXON_ID=96639 /ORGANISM=" , Strain NY0313808BC1" /LENGTH=717 /DNA_ID=CAMNT_0050631059 /DNA_START=294 /DNA_END=2447 /DNA_ORIENTATION=-
METIVAASVENSEVDTICRQLIDSLVKSVSKLEGSSSCASDGGDTHTEATCEIRSTGTATGTDFLNVEHIGKEKPNDTFASLKGKRVRVYWSGEKEYFVGSVVKSKHGKDLVLYDDGDRCWERREEVEVLPESQNPVNTVIISELPKDTCIKEQEKPVAQNILEQALPAIKTLEANKVVETTSTTPLGTESGNSNVRKIKVSMNGVDIEEVPKSMPISDIHHYSSETIPNDISELILDLTKQNMKHMYDGSKGWEKWDDVKKHKELICSPGMQFLVLRSNTLESSVGVVDESDTIAVCHDVLEGIVNQVVQGSETNQSVEIASKGKGRIVGFVAFRFLVEIKWDLLYVHELQLVDGARKKGIGRFLMEHLEEISRKLDVKYIMLTVLHANSGAVKFYKRLGFTVDEACPSICYQSEKVGYRILSKMMRFDFQKHRCIHCPKVYYRYYESLIVHNCLEHGAIWPYRCRIPGCKLGAIKRDQLRMHIDSHGTVDSQYFVYSQRSSATNNMATSPLASALAPQAWSSTKQHDTKSAPEKKKKVSHKRKDRIKPQTSAEKKRKQSNPVCNRVVVREEEQETKENESLDEEEKKKPTKKYRATSQDILCQRVTIVDGTTGMVCKASNGLYTIRLDGNPPQYTTKKRRDFVVQVPKKPEVLARIASNENPVFDPEKLLPEKQVKKEKDPDFLLAMELHYKDVQTKKKRIRRRKSSTSSSSKSH